MKPPPGTARTEVIPSELLEKFLAPVHNALAAPHMGLGGVSPSYAYLRSRKEGRSSKLSFRMTHLLVLESAQSRPQGGTLCQTEARSSRSGGVAQRCVEPDKRAGLRVERACRLTQCWADLVSSVLNPERVGLDDRGR